MGATAGLRAQEGVVETQSINFTAEVAERMDVGIALPAPVGEFDAQLVGRAGGAHEVRLVDAEALVKIAQVRQGGFANAGIYSNERFFQILDETENFTDQAAYDELMAEAQNILTELDPPAIFYGELLWTTALRANIKGFNFNPIYLSAYPFYRMYRDTSA